jgi:septum formation protein
MSRPTLILASTSPFRKSLLERLGLPFSQIDPQFDESALENELSDALVQRLAVGKAGSVYQSVDATDVVIGSDQVADLNGEIIGKPHTHDAAVAQLTALSGQTVMFHTGVCVMTRERRLQAVVTTQVRFKSLSPGLIERYLQADQPYGCAASFKSECLGSILVDYMRSDDPSALIGLPLITVARFLDELGVAIP